MRSRNNCWCASRSSSQARYSSRVVVDLRHRRGLGGGQGQLLWDLAAGVASPDRHARLKAFVAAFSKKYHKPPENQAWGDYMALKILAQSMNEVKSTEAPKMVENWEKGAKFDLLKTRRAILGLGPSADARNVCGRGVEGLRAEKSMGHLPAKPSGARRQRASRRHRPDAEENACKMEA